MSFTCPKIFKRKPSFEVKLDHKIVEAFVSNGVQYYQFADPFNLCSGRAYAANNFYTELEQKCSREVLIAHCQAMDNILNNPKQIILQDIVRLNHLLKERLELIIPEDSIFKLASVVYFDKNEKPYDYDQKYNYEKIKRWKKEGLSSFFLSKELKELTPFSNIAQTDFETLTTIGRQITDQHLKTLSSLLSSEQKNSEPINVLFSAFGEV